VPARDDSEPAVAAGGIEARRLCLARGGREVLRDVSLLVRCGLVAADSGEVLLQGQDILELEPRVLRRRVGLVAQVPVMHPGTVRDNVQTALQPILRRAITTGLVPAIDQTRSVGLVTLPGTFVGLVLGGASPASAARVQLLILLALLAVELFSALIVGRLLLAAVVAPGERVEIPPKTSCSDGVVWRGGTKPGRGGCR
jgi:hypothetical protein